MKNQTCKGTSKRVREECIIDLYHRLIQYPMLASKFSAKFQINATQEALPNSGGELDNSFRSEDKILENILKFIGRFQQIIGKGFVEGNDGVLKVFDYYK